MEAILNEKEVNFGQYCHFCIKSDIESDKFPCTKCLSKPSNLNSKRPIMWKLDPKKRKLWEKAVKNGDFE